MKDHRYTVSLTWTGNTGSGTSAYTSYQRDHIITVSGKPDIPGSSDPQFRGSASHYNPEEMLVASLAACHMLWYLHLCAEAGVVVTAYHDEAEGCMKARQDGTIAFQQVTLRPKVVVQQAAMSTKAEALHQQAHTLCFIANSVNFPVHHQASIRSEQP